MAAGLALAACDRPIQVRGHLPDEEAVAQIKPGDHSRSDVVEALGSPSAISTFEDDTWYYVGSKSRTFAFFEPDVLERSVLAVSFDEAERVRETRLYTLEDGRPVDPVDRITPTEGKDLTLLQQLLGNLGRFNTEQEGFQQGGAPGPSVPDGL